LRPPYLGLAAYPEAQDKAAAEVAAERGLGILYRLLKTAEQKEAQCLRAMGNKEFCRCIGTKLVSMDFVQYVALLAKTDEEVDKLSPEDKKTVDAARKCRDLCLK
jgi:hypothetical protein